MAIKLSSCIPNLSWEDIMTAGRPSLYKEQYCNDVVKMAKEGKLPNEWAITCGVGINTMRGWKQEHSKFSEAYGLAKTILHLEHQKKYDSIEDDFELRKHKFRAGALFHETEVQKVETKVEGKIEHDVTFDVSFANRDGLDLPFDTEPE